MTTVHRHAGILVNARRTAKEAWSRQVWSGAIVPGGNGICRISSSDVRRRKSNIIRAKENVLLVQAMGNLSEKFEFSIPELII
jgi:hypothetical protein